MARAIVRFWVVASTRAIVRVKIIFRSDVWVGLLLQRVLSLQAATAVYNV